MSFPPKKVDYKIKKTTIKNKNIDNIINESIKSFSSNVIIYKNNKKILDIENTKDNKLIETYSITKSFCAMAIMFLIQDKKIKSINDKISDYIISWRYGQKKDITIKHILTHTSGLDKHWDFNTFMFPDGKFELLGKKKKPNVKDISLVIDKNRENDKEWYYNDTATQIIPTLIHIITGIQLDKYLEQKLFKPLNIKYKWNKDDHGNPYGPNGLSISADDLCKVGLFILNNGKFNNKQILNNKLITEMLKSRITSEQMKNDSRYGSAGTGYGYLWWEYNKLKWMSGFLGQHLIIDKKKKIVACRLIEPKWANKKFEKETQKDILHFNNFKKLIDQMK